MESLNLNKPHSIILVGIPGSGKSFFAEQFADTFKAPIISFDQLRQELFNIPTFNKNEDIIISRVAAYMLKEVLKTGQTIIYDGQTNLRTERALIAKKSREAGYEPLFVWVQTELSTAKKRALRSGTNKPALSIEQFNNKLKQFSAPHQIEKAIVISGKHTYASQLKIILKHLVEPLAQKIESTNQSRIISSHNILIH